MKEPSHFHVHISRKLNDYFLLFRRSVSATAAAKAAASNSAGGAAGGAATGGAATGGAATGGATTRGDAIPLLLASIISIYCF